MSINDVIGRWHLVKVNVCDDNLRLAFPFFLMALLFLVQLLDAENFFVIEGKLEDDFRLSHVVAQIRVDGEKVLGKTLELGASCHLLQTIFHRPRPSVLILQLALETVDDALEISGGSGIDVTHAKP